LAASNPNWANVSPLRFRRVTDCPLTLAMPRSWAPLGCRLVGVDFSRSNLEVARELEREQFPDLIKIHPEYVCADASAYLETVAVGTFDTVISERLVVNRPSWQRQRVLIEGIIDRLPVGGRYLMMEGLSQLFKKLNHIRKLCGLPEVPDRYPGDESSNKLDEPKLAALLASRADAIVRREQDFGCTKARPNCG
jgi:hypothetical protein